MSNRHFKAFHTVQQLFERALRVKLNDTAYWKYVSQLRRRGERYTFLTAKDLCHSRILHRRVLGIDVLCQLRHYKNEGKPDRHNSSAVFVHASRRIIRPLLQDGRIDVLISAIHALGHLSDPKIACYVSRFSTHRNWGVRRGVACALGGEESPLAIRTLIKLTEDKSAQVRDWATFGIGDLIEKDSSEIREALFRRVKDRSIDTRNEAMVGLAKRKDPRAIELVLKALREESPRAYALIAAREFAHPVFLPELKKRWNGLKSHRNLDYWESELRDAIKACRLSHRKQKKM